MIALPYQFLTDCYQQNSLGQQATNPLFIFTTPFTDPTPTVNSKSQRKRRVSDGISIIHITGGNNRIKELNLPVIMKKFEIVLSEI